MPSVLFVCSGNTCRSPIAEALFKARLERAGINPSRWRVESAGTSAAENQPASPEALQVMAERGLNLTAHRSHLVDGQRLADFDLVLCMEAHHKTALMASFPEYASKVHLLSEMADQTANITDPFGQPVSAYQRTAIEIDTWLAQGWNTIFQMLIKPNQNLT